MLVSAVEFDICDLIVAAINSASLDSANFGGFHVTAVLDPAGTIELSQSGEDVTVFVIPASVNSESETLDSIDRESIRNHVIVAKKTCNSSSDEVRNLVSLCRSIWSVIESDVTPVMEGLIFSGREADPLYDHENLRDKGQFYSECRLSWILFRSE